MYLPRCPTNARVLLMKSVVFSPSIDVLIHLHNLKELEIPAKSLDIYAYLIFFIFSIATPLPPP